MHDVDVRYCYYDPMDNVLLYMLQDDYYSHPEQYRSIFHETIAPYTSVIGAFHLRITRFLVLVLVILKISSIFSK